MHLIGLVSASWQALLSHRTARDILDDSFSKVTFLSQYKTREASYAWGSLLEMYPFSIYNQKLSYIVLRPVYSQDSYRTGTDINFKR